MSDTVEQPQEEEDLGHLLKHSNSLLKRVHKVSSEILEECEEEQSNFRVVHVVLYFLFLIGGFILGYTFFAYRRDPSKEDFYNKYPSAFLGDSDVF